MRDGRIVMDGLQVIMNHFVLKEMIGSTCSHNSTNLVLKYFCGDVVM